MSMLDDRVTSLNRAGPRNGKCVVYWMQSSLRLGENPALSLAAREAEARHQPLLLFFCLDPSIPSANERNFTFLLEGLKDVADHVDRMGAGLCIRIGNAVDNAVQVCQEADASLLVTDESHLREGRVRRGAVARTVRIPLLQVDANVIVPVRLLPGEQYAAYTIRPRLLPLLEHYLSPAAPPDLTVRSPPDVKCDIDSIDIPGILRKLALPHVEPSCLYHGGEAMALDTLKDFVERKLDGYAELRNHPELAATSDLSPYLRFGNISPARVIREVLYSQGPQEGVAAFIEEAYVRRELAENFTFYDRNYRSLASLPDWARTTLDVHRRDRRQRLFDIRALEEARTGDELWDASQLEMARTGKMAGYMRMYWGKRVLEWTRTPEDALRALLYLNDKYEIDGRSPNGYAGILWCFGKHDRAFAERPVYGKVRYMSPGAQKKKFDMRAYIKKSGFNEKVAYI